MPKFEQSRCFLEARKSAIRKSLLPWYRTHARAMPWRESKEPYRIWVSEIMLQQTRVDTVIDYFNRFLKAFPTLQKLAAAKEDRVLKLWEGLGYYSRARNMQKAAQHIVKNENGAFPTLSKDLLKLPGIGKYTAAAIASIAFGEAVAVLDGNVKRVLARVSGLGENIDEGKTVAVLWEFAELLLSSRSPGNFNQAMMELGATVCLPRKPDCTSCPLRKNCVAFARDSQEIVPVRTKKKAVPHHTIVAAAIFKKGRYLLGRRPVGGMLGGLWEFPGGKVEAGETKRAALRREIVEELGVSVRVGKKIASVNHAYSHFKISLHVYYCDELEGEPVGYFHSALKWVPFAKFKGYAFPKANLLVIAAM